jgi:putative transposase
MTMVPIDGLLSCLTVCLAATPLRQLSVIVPALLAMSGRVTMLGISRWTEAGGSYRTVQRFFDTPIHWVQLHWCLIRHHLFEKEATYILAGDEVVVTKAGHATYGLDRFFSSLYNRPVPSLCFFNFSLINTQTRTAYPVLSEQVVREKVGDLNAVKKKKKKGPQSKQKRKPGRPKGSKNKNKEQPELSAYLRFIQDHLKALLARICMELRVLYVVLDGAFGDNDTTQMIRQCDQHFISKLRYNSALYFPYEGPYAGRGPRRKYGDKLDYDHIPQEYLKESTTEEDIQTDIYQMTLLHRRFAKSLNVVIIVKTNLTTQRKAHVVLFSSDLELVYDKLMDYYQLRFQIEFNFRDAKQYWGLEDFMNIKQTPIYNSVNLSFLMVNLSQVLIQKMRSDMDNPDLSVQDLKAHFRGLKYVNETLKLLPQKPDPILFQRVSTQIAKLGAIHAA